MKVQRPNAATSSSRTSLIAIERKPGRQKLPGSPGMADGNVAMPEGMGPGECWRKKGKQDGSS
jgi:hypothetical protein